MLNLVDLPDIAKKAIRSNFASRNTRVFVNDDRHLRIRAQRRNQVREWISVLRIVRNPAIGERVSLALKDAGPLMAHDLRNRIIIAGLEHRLAELQPRP